MMKFWRILPLFIVLACLAAGAWLYPSLPEQMVSHWGISGEPNGYTSKLWGVFILPIISLVLVAVFTIIPRIDPLKNNIEKFRNSFDLFVCLLVLFLSYIWALMIAWNLGYKADINIFLPPSLAVFYYFVGVIIAQSKRNWFIGIRTPWTLSSDRVWDETKVIGGKLFKVAALIALIGLLTPKYSFYFVIVPIILVTIYTIIFSYWSYRREK